MYFIYIYIYIRTYTYIYTYIHTYTYTYICNVLFWASRAMSGNEGTRQLAYASCFCNCGPDEHSEFPVGFQAKP